MLSFRSAPPLDPGTLLFSISVLAFLMAAMAFSSMRTLPDLRFGLREWGKAMLAAGGAFLLFFFRGHAPWFLGFVVANLLVMLVPVYGLLAHARLMSRQVSRRLLWGIYGFGVSGVAVSYGLGTSTAVAVVTLSSAIALLFLATAVLVLSHARQHRNGAVFVAGLVMAAMAAGFLMRAVLSLFGQAEAVSPGAPSRPQIGVLLMGALFVVGASIGFFSMVHERQRQEVLDRARRDGLTGLFTRMAFMDMGRALEQARPPVHFAVAMIDLDHFKQVNDTHGHAAGDVVLAHAARLIANTVRSTDLVGRYGGEEFCVLLRDCSLGEASVFAARLVEAARHQAVRLPGGGEVAFTVSVGCAARRLLPQPEALMQTLARADKALYDAKHQGRDRWVAQALPQAPSRGLAG